MKHLVWLLALILSSCAHPMKEREFNPALCEEGLAYQAGFNDGRDGMNMNAGFTYGCREDLRTSAMKGYKEGYEKGHEIYQKQVAEQRKAMAEMEKNRLQADANARAQANPPPPIVYSGGGFYGGSATYTRWFCKMSPFMDVFEGSGASELEARQNTQRLCENKLGRGSIHCDQASCTSELASYNQKAWYCSFSVFGDKFDAWGGSRTEALRSSRKACEVRHGAFHCKDEKADCQQAARSR